MGSAKNGKVTSIIPKIDERSKMEGIGGPSEGSIFYGAEEGLSTVVKFVRK